MTWPACAAEAAATLSLAAATDLQTRRGADGSFSLWSANFGEGFHSGRGALREARETFVLPSQLARFGAGRRLRVVEVCVGTGTNLAALLEASAAAGLELEWWGLELDPTPLQRALAEPAFRGQWQPQSLETLQELSERGCWQSPIGCGHMLWGDARRTLPKLVEQHQGQVDRIWHDAFSPQHCPQLWTVEVLGSLAALLAPGGRWLSYCSAAAVREGLRLAGLHLVALSTPHALPEPEQTLSAPQPSAGGEEPGQGVDQRRTWSGGTVASTTPLESSPLWRPLSAMEREHQASSAGEPYRDPSGTTPAQAILESRREAQATALACGSRYSSRSWRRRWGIGAKARKLDTDGVGSSTDEVATGLNP